MTGHDEPESPVTTNRNDRSRSTGIPTAIWNDVNKQFKPIEKVSDFDVYEILDSITLAVEAGVVDSYFWPQQLFANRKALEDFIEELSCYDELYRITDQWWMALASLAETCDTEEDFVSCQEIANTLLDIAASEGRMENFGRKKPKYLYSEAQCAEACVTRAKQQSSHGNFMSDEEYRPVSEMADFARHYSIQIPTEKIVQAQKEGKAILNSTYKKVASKKSSAIAVSVQ